MFIDANLECWLCGKSYGLRLDLYANTVLGTPHFWCRDCTGPRTLSRRLKRLISDASRPATVRNMNADDMAMIKRVLARLDGNEMDVSSLSEWRQYADFTRDESDESDMAA
jgi:hypothetical protein